MAKALLEAGVTPAAIGVLLGDSASISKYRLAAQEDLTERIRCLIACLDWRNSNYLPEAIHAREIGQEMRRNRQFVKALPEYCGDF